MPPWGPERWYFSNHVEKCIAGPKWTRCIVINLHHQYHPRDKLSPLVEFRVQIFMSHFSAELNWTAGGAILWVPQDTAADTGLPTKRTKRKSVRSNQFRFRVVHAFNGAFFLLMARNYLVTSSSRCTLQLIALDATSGRWNHGSCFKLGITLWKQVSSSVK